MALSIKSWRMARGISQTKLAESLGVSTTTVVNWEKHPESMSAGMLCKWCEVLKVEPSQIDFFCPKAEQNVE